MIPVWVRWSNERLYRLLTRVIVDHAMSTAGAMLLPHCQHVVEVISVHEAFSLQPVHTCYTIPWFPYDSDNHQRWTGGWLTQGPPVPQLHCYSHTAFAVAPPATAVCSQLARSVIISDGELPSGGSDICDLDNSGRPASTS